MEVKNIVKELWVSWKESLFLYKDKRFWLVVLKTIKESYSLFFKRFWWLIFLYYISEFFLSQALKKISLGFSGSVIGLSIVKLLITALVYFLLILVVRPSLARKDTQYYKSYWKYFPIFFIILLLFWALWYIVPLFLSGSSSFNYGYFILRSAIHFTTIVFSPFVLFYTFFYFDSHLNVRNIILRLWSAFKMLIYTCPFCIIQTWLISLIVSCLIGAVWLILLLIKSEVSFGAVFDTLAIYGPLLVAPLFIGIFYPLYTKQVHDHYDRYAL